MKYGSHVSDNKCRPRDSLLLPDRIGKKKIKSKEENPKNKIQNPKSKIKNQKSKKSQ